VSKYGIYIIKVVLDRKIINIYIHTNKGCQKMYTHFKRCCLCKMCTHFLAPFIYIYISVRRVPKKCIHIRGCLKMYTHFKRCYPCKIVYILWHPLCIYIYIYIYILLITENTTGYLTWKLHIDIYRGIYTPINVTVAWDTTSCSVFLVIRTNVTGEKMLPALSVWNIAAYLLELQGVT